MRTKRLLLAGAITAVAVVVFATTLLRGAVFSSNPDELSTPVPRQVAAVGSGLPDRLIIPTLNIDAHVQHVGLGKSGNMAVPTNYTDVAWYRLGAVPGSMGSAVFDGHVDNGFSLPGVFKHLSDIQVGDSIFVQDSAGKRLEFVVEQATAYPLESVPLERIFKRADAARLVLITCDGAWLKDKKTYDERLVVFAKLKG
jgi:sortase (surface protein transpeptidase)